VHIYGKTVVAVRLRTTQNQVRRKVSQNTSPKSHAWAATWPARRIHRRATQLCGAACHVLRISRLDSSWGRDLWVI